MKRLLLLTLALGSAAASADDAGLRRCRALPDAGARLACYDALPLAPAAATAPAAAPLGAGAAVVAPVAAAAAAKAAPAPSSPAGFGFEARELQGAEMSSRISGDFEGWGPRTRIKLENGQVWQVSDDSSAYVELKSPRVKVQRAVLGGFVMDIEGAPRSPRVRRLE